jgi:hypothetical protein
LGKSEEIAAPISAASGPSDPGSGAGHEHCRTMLQHYGSQLVAFARIIENRIDHVDGLCCFLHGVLRVRPVLQIRLTIDLI